MVEYKTILKEKIQDVELTQVKQELLKEVTDNFSQDMQGLKRYVEMSSGGGTNAVQYANGGTMNGDLNVNGKVGIGITEPTKELEVIGDIKMRQNSAFSNFGLIDQTEALMTFETKSINTNSHPGDIVFKPNEAEKMRITDDGKLEVNGSAIISDTLSAKEDVYLRKYSTDQHFGTGQSFDPRYTLGVNLTGGLVQATREKVFHVTGAQIKTLSSQAITILPAAGTGKYNVVRELMLFIDKAGAVGTYPTRFKAQVGTFDPNKVITLAQPFSASFVPMGTIPRSIFTFFNRHSSNYNGDLLYVRDAPSIGGVVPQNRPLILYAPEGDFAGGATTPGSTFKFKLTYTEHSTADFDTVY